jgi:type IV pilus assembly protein PilC
MNLVYEAIDKQGRRIHDRLDAASQKEGIEELRRRGLFVTQISSEGKNDAACKPEDVSSRNIERVRLPLGQLNLFTRQMSMLLTSGSAVVPALAAIGGQMRRPEYRQVLNLMKEDLEGGVSLTDALRRFPRSFDGSYCAVVAAGESSATLPQMFSRLAVIMNRQRAVRNRLVGALVYPLMLSAMSVNIMGVMLFFVIPRFATMFTTLNVDLPASTRMMMSISSGLRTYWPIPLLAGVSLITGAIMLLKTNGGKQLLSNAQIRIPVIGRLTSRLIQGKTFRILGMLLESRVGLLEALELARQVTRNDRFQALFDQFEEAITRGESISGAAENSKLIGLSVVQAIRTGEQSGRLGESITYVADVLDEENAELLGAVTKLIEPLILILMGCVVGTVAVSLFMPLFDMTSAM